MKKNLKETVFKIKHNGEYVDVHGYHITKKGKVYGKRIYKDGHIEWKELSVYKNIVNDKGFEYLRFHARVNGKSCIVTLHNVLGQLYIPGYEPGLVCDHIDKNTLNNDLTNLQWISREENSRLAWTRLTNEEKQARAKSYGESVKKAHAEGKYDEHMKRLAKLNSKTSPKAQNSQNLELLDDPGINIPTETEMNKMVSYFLSEEELKKKVQEELDNLFKD